MPPVKIVNDYYMDGGLVDISPVDGAQSRGATHIDIISTGPDRYIGKGYQGSHLFNLIPHVIDTMGAEIVRNDYLSGTIHDIPVNKISPKVDLIEDSMDFSHDQMVRIWRKGLEDARKHKWSV
jgi:predicted acylesterase/phospholipase RssA